MFDQRSYSADKSLRTKDSRTRTRLVPTQSLRENDAQVFVASDDRAAAATVAALAEDVGFRAVHLGEGSTAMRAAEALGDVIRFILIDTGAKGSNIGIRNVHRGALGLVGERQPSSYQ